MFRKVKKLEPLVDLPTEKSTLLERAISLALEAHSGQKDKAGEEYILHPLRLMLQMKTENERIVAVLHDVVEDGDSTCEDLVKMGFAMKVVEAIDLLTHKKRDSYEEFIAKIKPNKLARKVKIADIKHNSEIDRIPSPTDKDYERREKYKKALQALE